MDAYERTYIATLLASAVSFGIWQSSWAAGIWFFTLIVVILFIKEK